MWAKFPQIRLTQKVPTIKEKRLSWTMLKLRIAIHPKTPIREQRGKPEDRRDQ